MRKNKILQYKLIDDLLFGNDLQKENAQNKMYEIIKTETSGV